MNECCLNPKFEVCTVQESATLRPAAAAVLHEVRRIANVYVIAHVADDLGEATVRGALEAGEPHGPEALDDRDYPFALEIHFNIWTCLSVVRTLVCTYSHRLQWPSAQCTDR